ncbi:hypothetical protein AN958_07116 [Leucoagaricus sp. SymC.cos]|nr:hypothetical protein AN958_07116 [Leucoagaricus sp. SymC.cos]
MDLEVPGVKVKHLMGVSRDLQKLFVEKAQTQKVPTAGTATSAVMGVTIDFSTPLQEVEAVVRGKDRKQVGEMGLLDEGSDIEKDRNICIVHNPTPFNAATIGNLQMPPLVYLYAE